MQRWVWTIWVCFVVRAAFFCTVLPLWEGLDEYSHFAVIQHLAETGHFPAVTAESSSEVTEAMRAGPVPWTIRDPAGGLLSYDDYWQLAPDERVRREQRLRTLPRELAQKAGDARLYMYEAQHAPLYYWIAAPVYRAVRGFDVPTRLWVLRCLTALLSSAVVPLMFLAARRVFADVRIAVGLAAITALLPELMLSAFRVGNEGLAIAMGALAAYVLLDRASGKTSVRQGVAFGAALGLVLLTKAYFLALLPGAALVLWWTWRERGRGAALAAAAVGAAVCGWWYVGTLLATGSLTGEQYHAAARHSELSLLDAVLRMHWIRVIDFVAASNIWLGNWSYLVVRSWMYRVVEVTALLGAAGACVQAWRGRAGLPGRRQLMVMALLVAGIAAGLAYNAVSGLRSIGVGSTVGYYLYGVVVPEVLLVMAGLARLLPDTWRRLPLAVGAVMLAALEWYGTWLLLLPYYTGLIRHGVDGSLRAFSVAAYGAQAATLVERLAMNKAAFVTPGVVVALMAAFGAATLVLCAIGGCMAIRRVPPAGTAGLH